MAYSAYVITALELEAAKVNHQAARLQEKLEVVFTPGARQGIRKQLANLDQHGRELRALLAYAVNSKAPRADS